MTAINLEDLSVEALEALKGDIDATMERKRNGELFALREQIEELVDNSPFTLEEILAAQKVRKPVAPKYRNPDDASETWTGRGRKPRWVEAFLDAGNNLEDVAI